MASRLEVKDYIPMIRRKVWYSRIGNCEGFCFDTSGIPAIVFGPQCNTKIGAYFLAFFCFVFSIASLFFYSAYHLMSIA